VNNFLNIRKLYQGTFTLSGQNLPKFLGCSNFMVWNPKEMSQSERIHCVEFSDFFNKAVMYGGDITRKMKLRERQKEGKKRMQDRGSVNIPQDVFLKMMRIVDGV
jgi:hypothetical protein